MNPDDLRKADAVEVVVGQGAKPGGGGMLLGHKISDRVAEMRDLPKGIDAAPRGIPDSTGPDDLEIKIGELREITDWEKPIFVKVEDADVLRRPARREGRRRDRRRRDAGRDGGHAGRFHRARRHSDAAGRARRRRAPGAWDAPAGAADRLRRIRTGADVAGRLRSARTRSGSERRLAAMGDNAPEHDEAYRRIGSAAGYYDDWQAGRDLVGISTQEDELAARFDPELGGRRIANYLQVLTLETCRRSRARAGSPTSTTSNRRLVALTVEAAAMARVPLAGTDWIPGQKEA